MEDAIPFDQGEKSIFVSVHALEQARQALESFKHRTPLNAFQAWIVDEFYRFDLPKTPFPIRSLLLVAVPHPLYAPILMRYDGRIYPSLSLVRSDFDRTRARLASYAQASGVALTETPSIPVKRLAVQSGLAVYGRNNITYVDGLGSNFSYLAYCTSQECPETPPNEVRMAPPCHGCNACITACPTHALSEDRFLLDTDRCLAFLNEAGAPFPAWVPPTAHHTLYDCLKCQLVCPMNRHERHRIGPRVAFSEEETVLLLASTPYDQSPDPLKKKMRFLGLDQWPEGIAKNIRQLVTHGRGIAPTTKTIGDHRPPTSGNRVPLSVEHTGDPNPSFLPTHAAVPFSLSAPESHEGTMVSADPSPAAKKTNRPTTPTDPQALSKQHAHPSGEAPGTGSTLSPSSRRLAKSWPYPRYSRFEAHLRRAATTWFRRQGYQTHPRMPYCLARYELWPHNILCGDVVDFIMSRRRKTLDALPWPLHKYLHHGLSSQAMLLNVLGPLIVRHDQSLLRDIIRALGIDWPHGNTVSVFEYSDRSIFQEDAGQPTSIDLAFRTPHGSLFLEAKLAEREFGGCSVFSGGDCSGANPYPDNLAHCYLHHIGRTYWSWAKELGFVTTPIFQGPLCPFANSYQFFRETLFALAQGGSYVLLYDARNPAFLKTSPHGQVSGLWPLLHATIPPEFQDRVIPLPLQDLTDRIAASGRHHDWILDFQEKYGLAPRAFREEGSA